MIIFVIIIIVSLTQSIFGDKTQQKKERAHLKKLVPSCARGQSFSSSLFWHT